MTEDQRQALRADLEADLEDLRAAEAARRAEARARGEPIYPDPGFKASRLIEPEPYGDFGYRINAGLGGARRNPDAGAPDARMAAAREQAAMAALKTRRGCPLWVAGTYVEALRRAGAWWNDVAL